MKLTHFFPITTLLLIASIVGCNSETTDLSKSEASIQNSDIILKSANAPILESVYLGTAGDFAILSKTGVTNVFESDIVGDVGASPITGAAVLVSCAEVTGTIYTVDAAGPLPCSVNNAILLTTAVSDMQIAYNDASGRLNPDFLNLGAGNIGGLTLSPGLYNWSSGLNIPTDVTLDGGPNDIFIFQIAGTLTMSSAKSIILSGGVLASNIYWVVADAVTIGTTAHFEGNILGQTGINLQTGASINGRMLAQTAVTLQKNSVVIPALTVIEGNNTSENNDNSDSKEKKDKKAHKTHKDKSN